MKIQKLDGTDAFVALDLDGATSAVGQVRMAPKVLRGGAKLLARSWTYLFATYEKKVGGASAGINAAADDQDGAVAAFVEELTPVASEGGLALEPAKGVTAEQLAPLLAADSRSDAYTGHADILRGLSAALSADAALGGLDGAKVIVEGFDAAGPELVRSVCDRGATVVGLSTGNGSVLKPSGLEPAVLSQAWREYGPALVEHTDVATGEPADVFGCGADVLFCGSKAGIVDHEVAAGLEVRAVVPVGPVPVTARALAVLRRADTQVMPDFISTSGPLFAMWPDADVSLDGLRGSVSIGVLGALGEVLDHPDGAALGACYRAEAFLATWQDTLPFGRPLA